MSEIPKAYEPQSVEDKWYDAWQKQGCFTADRALVGAKRLRSWVCHSSALIIMAYDSGMLSRTALADKKSRSMC